MDLLVENAIIVTMDAERRILNPGHLVVRGKFIAEVGPGEYAGDRGGMDRMDAQGHIVIPGLINAHTHSYGNLIKGRPENLPLEIWGLYVLAAQRLMEPEDVVINVGLGCLEMLAGGVTTCLDHLAADGETLELAVREYRRIGFRVVLAPMFSDVPYAATLPEVVPLPGGEHPHLAPNIVAQADAILAMVGDVVARCHRPQDGVVIAVGPSGPQRCSDELLVGAMDLAERLDLPWHTHLLETQAQEVTAERLYGQSMVRHLYHLGLLRPRTSLAHGVWLSHEDMELLAATRANLIINPVSNLALGSGIPPLIQLQHAHVSLGLGTDGSASSGCQSGFEAMKLVAILGKVQTFDFSRWPTAMQALEMATIGSARAVGIDRQVGSLEPGKEADIVFLRRDLVPLTPLQDVVWQLVYGRPEAAVEQVMVSGRTVVADGRVLTVDKNAVLMAAADRGRRLMLRCQEAYSAIQPLHEEMKAMLQRAYAVPSCAAAGTAVSR